MSTLLRWCIATLAVGAILAASALVVLDNSQDVSEADSASLVANSKRVYNTRVNGWSTRRVRMERGRTMAVTLRVVAGGRTWPRRVVVQRRGADGRWRAVSSRRTGRNGRVRVRVKAWSTGHLRAYAPPSRRARGRLTRPRPLSVVLGSPGSAGGSGGSGSSGGSGDSGGTGGTGGTQAPPVPVPLPEPEPGWDGGSGGAEADSFEAEVLRLTNQYRSSGTSCGGETMPPVQRLSASPPLAGAARGFARKMAARGFFDHLDPDTGQGPAARVEAQGYRWDGVGENIVRDLTTPLAVVRALHGSAEHCSTMMDERWSDLGVGWSGTDDQRWVQVFGQPTS